MYTVQTVTAALQDDAAGESVPAAGVAFGLGSSAATGDWQTCRARSDVAQQQGASLADGGVVDLVVTWCCATSYLLAEGHGDGV